MGSLVRLISFVYWHKAKTLLIRENTGKILLKVHYNWNTQQIFFEYSLGQGKHIWDFVPLATKVACIFHIWKAFRSGHSLFLSEKYVFNNTYRNGNQAHMCIFSVEVRLQAHVVFAEYSVCSLWCSFLGESSVFFCLAGTVMSVSMSDIIFKVKILGNIIPCIVPKPPQQQCHPETSNLPEYVRFEKKAIVSGAGCLHIEKVKSLINATLMLP